MKIFISQPMKGKTKEEITSERDALVKRLKADGHEVIDSVFDAPPGPNQALWFLGESFKLLSTADGVWFMDGWKEARGCRMEFEAAVHYNINILYF